MMGVLFYLPVLIAHIIFPGFIAPRIALSLFRERPSISKEKRRQYQENHIASIPRDNTATKNSKCNYETLSQPTINSELPRVDSKINLANHSESYTPVNLEVRAKPPRMNNEVPTSFPNHFPLPRGKELDLNIPSKSFIEPAVDNAEASDAFSGFLQNSLFGYGYPPYIVYPHLPLEKLKMLSEQEPDENKLLNCKAIFNLACGMKPEEFSSLLAVAKESIIELFHHYNKNGPSALSTFVLKDSRSTKNTSNTSSPFLGPFGEAMPTTPLRGYLPLESDNKDCFPFRSEQEHFSNAASAMQVHVQVQSGNNISLDRDNLSSTTETPDQIDIRPNLYQ